MLKRAAALVAVAILLCCGRFASAQSARTFADVSVNGVEHGRFTIVLDDDDVFITAADLASFGIAATGGVVRKVGNETYVSLKSLAPGVRFRFDPKAQTLALNVEAADFGRHDVAIPTEAVSAAGVDSRRPSFFANYAGSIGTGSAGGFAEAGLHGGSALLYTNLAAQTGQAAMRGQTYLAFDDVPDLRRIQAGDSTIDGDSLMGSAQLLGGSVQRQFTLDPYIYTFPQPALAGAIPTEGTAQIYINGALTRTIQLQPGNFDLSSLPVTTGSNQISVLVRDANGNVQTYGQSYFAVESLLRKGLTDYQYGVGFLRESGTSQYGAPAAAGFYRIGATDAVTYSARFNGNATLQSGELGTDFKVGAGAIHVGVAGSTGNAGSGSAVDFETALSGSTASIGGGVSARSTRYETLGEQVGLFAPPRDDFHLNLAQQLGRRLSISLFAERQLFPSPILQPAQNLVTATLSSNLGASSSALLSVQRSRSGSNLPATSVYATYLRTLGPRQSVATTFTAASAGAGGSVEYRSYAPSSDQGFGYAVQTGAGTQVSQLSLTEHASFADLSGALARGQGGALAGYANVAGGFVAAGGYVLPSRPVGDGFAVVDASGLPGVQVTLDGRLAGLTDAHGLLVIPGLGSNGNNTIAIDRNALPLGVEVTNDQTIVSPAYRGGAVATIPLRRITYVTGSLRVLAGTATTVPAFGRMIVTVAGRQQRSELDADGSFYFENLAPGRYPAVVLYPGGTCTFALNVKPSKTIGTNLGELTCRN